jgi:hypothetical protein
MENRNIKHLFAITLIAALLILSVPAFAEWQLLSDYDMDGSYTATPPGTGDALLDAGPAANNLYTVTIGGSYPDSQPALSSPGSDGTGDAFTFSASEGDTLHGPWSANLMEGFKVSFDFKESGSQTNAYPRFCRVETSGSISAGGFKVQTLASGGELTAIEFWMYPGGDKCSVSGNWNDGQWHHVDAEYDPLQGQMVLTVDSQSSTATFTNTGSIVPDKIKLGFPYDDDSTGLERGFDGSIDNFEVYQRQVNYQLYTSYDMDGTYDRNAGTGTALADSGPVSNNPLNQFGSLNNAPSQELSGYSNEAFSFDGLEPQLFTSDFTMDMTNGFIGKLKFKSDVIPDSVQAYPYLLRMDGGSALVLQGMYRTDPNRFDNLSMSFAGEVTLSMANPGGSGWNDNAWHEITFGYEPDSSGGWTFVKIDDDDELESYKQGVTTISSNTAMTIGATESLNNRYGYSGIIDEVEFYYAVLANEVLAPAMGEVLYWDEGYVITWDADVHLTAGQVSIEFSSDNGLNWSLVDTVSNTGSYLWTVPQVTESNQCLIRIKNPNDDNIIYAVSDLFTILQECTIDSDISGDCEVDLIDFAELGKEWLQ